MGLLGCEDHVLGVSGSRVADCDVSFATDGFDLSLEYNAEAVVVPDRGDRGYVGKTDPGKSGTVDEVPSGELRRYVLRISRRTSVSHENRLVAVPESLDQDIGRGTYGRGIDARDDAGTPRELFFDGISHLGTSKKSHRGVRT